MGYDVHITRAADWLDSELSPITLGEWKEYVESDPEMVMEGFADAPLPNGHFLRYENEGLARWIAHPTSTTAWFDHRGGQIIVKNPDDLMIAKMGSIASAFGARVEGDDGEEYYPVDTRRKLSFVEKLVHRWLILPRYRPRRTKS